MCANGGAQRIDVHVDFINFQIVLLQQKFYSFCLAGNKMFFLTKFSSALNMCEHSSYELMTILYIYLLKYYISNAELRPPARILKNMQNMYNK